MNGLGERQPGLTQAAISPENQDAALVAAIIRKDRKATAEFVARFADPVYAYTRSRLAPRYDLVDDLVQEVFVAAWEGLAQYRGTGPLQAWMLGIARHKIESHYRAILRAPEPLEDAQKDHIPASIPEFEQLLDQKQLQSRTWRTMAALPEQYRLVLVWRYWEMASAREMAEKTGKTEKAIERLLARARDQFRERWEHA